MAQSVTLSSVGTATIILNPVYKSTSVMLTGGGSSAGTVQIEMTLDDPTIAGGPSLSWGLLSSGTAMLSSNVSSLVYTVLSPIGGVRINSSANGGLGTWTLKALQAVTA
jgi:hypothetical protein